MNTERRFYFANTPPAPQTSRSLGHALPAPRRAHVRWHGVLTVCALPSPASKEDCSSFFGWFTGTAAQSDFSCTFMSAVRFRAFADRS
jgi:hypothetical protein